MYQGLSSGAPLDGVLWVRLSQSMVSEILCQLETVPSTTHRKGGPMNLHARALSEPKRPNVRKVPLDPWEVKMVEIPMIQEEPPDGISLKAWLWGLGIVLPLWGVLGWWLL